MCPILIIIIKKMTKKMLNILCYINITDFEITNASRLNPIFFQRITMYKDTSEFADNRLVRTMIPNVFRII